MSTDLSGLNPQQLDAVMKSVNNNVVLLAGAGSGKTHTLIKRTEYLIADLGVSPQNIMLVTFTNKAANEIKDRISKISEEAYKMWIGTFHSICTKILRKFGYHLNIKSFTILDTKDSAKIIKKILTNNGEKADANTVKAYQTRISKLKNNLIKPNQASLDPDNDYMLCDVYNKYMDYCWNKKCFDFDDLIVYAILLLSSFDDVSRWMHDNIRYIMVDETQDTNSAQFILIKLLKGDNNIMLIGDVNQSIYAFRNAKPKYLENFADTTPNTLKLKLEQNYRSTRNIINAANEVIQNNDFGTKLEMFCDNEEGSKIQLYNAKTPFYEAQWLVSEIMMKVDYLGKDYSNFAIIYRTNYQSRIFEDALTNNGIPYVVFGSGSFYSRKEVRDLLAFCKCVINPFDAMAFERALGTFNGIGKKTINDILALADKNKITYTMALKEYVKGSARPSQKTALKQMIKVLEGTYATCLDIVNNVFIDTPYRSSMEALKTEEAKDSVQIMDEFKSMIMSMESKKSEDTTLLEMLDELSLLSDAKGEEKAKRDSVKLMTAHASKGLEFDTVFIVGAEEGSFPHNNSIITNNPEDIEEERRLFYVAMTRAEKMLYISRSEAIRDGEGYALIEPSRFLDEIPEEYREYTV